ncbi:MAG: MnmC family methyltransferase, partial [Pseudomonadota bacterium]
MPLSARFDDTYFSIDDGLAETREVFLRGNGLPERWQDAGRDTFRIGELGFGTGLNFFASLCAWQAGAAQRKVASLTFVSFERYPLKPEDMARALQTWPEVVGVSAPWLDALAAVASPDDGDINITIGDCTLELVVGDARRRIHEMRVPVDAWYLD